MQLITQACELSNETVYFSVQIDGNLVLLLCFSQTRELLSSKAALTIIAFFAAVNHSYDHKQRTLKHRNIQNGSKSTDHRSQTMTF